MEEIPPPSQLPTPPQLPAIGQFHMVDAKSIEVGRINMAFYSSIFIGAALAGLFFLWMSPLANTLKVGAFFVWLALIPALAIYSCVWPGISYRRISYCLKEDCIIIRRGVFWKIETVAPRSRIQHIDVAQGPLQRAWEISDLIIHTAGTRFAIVTLSGLSQELAPRLRDNLLAGSDDATI